MLRSRPAHRGRFLEISSMAKTSAAARLENFDQRLVRVEHILPTLATKEDLKAYATKADLQRAIEVLQRAIDQKIAPLATKAELLDVRDEIRRHLATKAELLELRAELRPHMDVQTEAIRGDIRLLAEYVEHLATKISAR